ncbi:hypothetical protein FSP39_013315 [Pinctada imbricata]|uniref:G-protein coupled receptors family 1 profile domain-containing protein n=1 Tax=Pinctada imbricata TaxID=66713 RepID=A0AA88XWM6_PINIB|nr:hypothetical protein FSP39_013315 [Pinctada imbricata]
MESTVTYDWTIMNGSIEISGSDAILKQLNKEKVAVLLPVIIILCIFMTAGIIGNLIVFYVYYFRMKKTPSHYFILFLAMLDLVSCCIGMPSELGDLLQPLTFSSPDACRFLRFVLCFVVISSGITLICVAFDRYYKVCKPLKGFPVFKVKLLCGVSFFIGLVLSWPSVVLYGVRTVETKVPGLNGTECSTSDAMIGTPLPVIYHVTLMAAFVVTFIVFVVLYSRIGLEIHRRKKMAIQRSTSSYSDFAKRREMTNSSMLSEEDSTSAISDEDHRTRKTAVRKMSSTQSNQLLVRCNSANQDTETYLTSPSGTLTKSDKLLVKRRKKSPFRSIRTTYIFLAVFIAFIVSYVPYLICNVLRFTKVFFHELNSNTEEIIYNLLVRSYFISNFVNPIIYSVLNKNFRVECRKIALRFVRRFRSQ